MSTFALIAIAFLVTVVSAKLIGAGRQPLADRLNILVVATTVPLYLAFIGHAIFAALVSR